MMSDETLERMRQLCLALPLTTERLSHGAPAWFVRLAIWCRAPPGGQRLLVEEDPVRFFVPPYVGHRGWVGVRLDVDVDWAEMAEMVEDAYRMVAPKGLVAQLDAK
jgi:hypothetical protein